MQSMTAYASRRGAGHGMTWLWEMRGVNARGFDLRLRLPDGLDGLETTIRATLKKALHRGNVTLSLKLNRDEAGGDLQLDDGQLDKVLTALDRVQSRAMDIGVTLRQPTAADVLAQRGVMRAEGDAADPAALTAMLKGDLAPLLADFTAMRSKEGAALQKIIAGQLDEISSLSAEAERMAKDRIPEQRRALRDNFAKVLAEVTEADEERLAQELALLAVKQDVTEELDRLRTHVAAAWEMIEDRRPMGRKLDFLAQEFNREANTLCSKAQHKGLTKTGLELKAVIDQMREQIQNVE